MLTRAQRQQVFSSCGGHRQQELLSFVETVPDSEADVEGNATLSTTISGGGQTSLLLISF